MTVSGGNERAALIGFKDHLRPKVVPGDAVYLMSEHGVTAVRGPHLAALVPLLDGTRDLPALLGAAAPAVPPAQVARIVGELTRRGLLDHRPPRERAETGRDGADSAARAYWEQAGGSAPAPTGTVRIVTLGELDPAPLRAACRSAGLVHASPGAPAALDLVICSDYLDPRLAALDAGYRADGRPWLLAKVTGTTLWAARSSAPEPAPAGTASPTGCAATARARSPSAAHSATRRCPSRWPPCPSRSGSVPSSPRWSAPTGWPGTAPGRTPGWSPSTP